MNRRNFLQAMAGAVGAMFAGRAVVEPFNDAPMRPEPTPAAHAIDGVVHNGFEQYLEAHEFQMDGAIRHEYCFVAGTDLREGEAVYFDNDGCVFPFRAKVFIADEMRLD